MDARRFAAFCSPNLPPLATVGADVTSKRIGKLSEESGGPGGRVEVGDLHGELRLRAWESGSHDPQLRSSSR